MSFMARKRATASLEQQLSQYTGPDRAGYLRNKLIALAVAYHDSDINRCMEQQAWLYPVWFKCKEMGVALPAEADTLRPALESVIAPRRFEQRPREEARWPRQIMGDVPTNPTVVATVLPDHIMSQIEPQLLQLRAAMRTLDANGVSRFDRKFEQLPSDSVLETVVTAAHQMGVLSTKTLVATQALAVQTGDCASLIDRFKGYGTNFKSVPTTCLDVRRAMYPRVFDSIGIKDVILTLDTRAVTSVMDALDGTGGYMFDFNPKSLVVPEMKPLNTYPGDTTQDRVQRLWEAFLKEVFPIVDAAVAQKRYVTLEDVLPKHRLAALSNKVDLVELPDVGENKAVRMLGNSSFGPKVGSMMFWQAVKAAVKRNTTLEGPPRDYAVGINLTHDGAAEAMNRAMPAGFRRQYKVYAPDIKRMDQTIKREDQKNIVDELLRVPIDGATQRWDRCRCKMPGVNAKQRLRVLEVFRYCLYATQNPLVTATGGTCYQLNQGLLSGIPGTTEYDSFVVLAELYALLQEKGVLERYIRRDDIGSGIWVYGDDIYLFTTPGGPLQMRDVELRFNRGGMTFGEGTDGALPREEHLGGLTTRIPAPFLGGEPHYTLGPDGKVLYCLMRRDPSRMLASLFKPRSRQPRLKTDLSAARRWRISRLIGLMTVAPAERELVETYWVGYQRLNIRFQDLNTLEKDLQDSLVGLELEDMQAINIYPLAAWALHTDAAPPDYVETLTELIRQVVEGNSKSSWADQVEDEDGNIVFV